MKKAKKEATKEPQKREKQLTETQKNAIIKETIVKPMFSNKEVMKSHIEKHKKDYPNFREADYLNRAMELLKAPLSESVKGFKLSNGKIYKYDMENNDFAVSNPDGTIATLFKPKKGLKYWERQVEKYGKS